MTDVNSYRAIEAILGVCERSHDAGHMTREELIDVVKCARTLVDLNREDLVEAVVEFARVFGGGRR